MERLFSYDIPRPRCVLEINVERNGELSIEMAGDKPQPWLEECCEHVGFCRYWLNTRLLGIAGALEEGVRTKRRTQRGVFVGAC